MMRIGMQFHKDPAFDAQCKRTLGYVVSGGAEIAECLSAIRKIRPGDYNGWHDAWRAVAEELDLSAEEERLRACSISAGEKWLRASNYYRSAYFFLEQNPQDERIFECLKLSKLSFQKALTEWKIPASFIEIPFEEIHLPGYLYLSENPDAPLIIDTGGGDSTLEEMYFYSAAPAMKRGFHCFTFEGPGQGSVLRFQKTPFRPDWETVLKAVIDWLEKTTPQYLKQIVLRGDSFGGYLAARAAAFENRISALIVNPGIVSPTASLQKLAPDWLRAFFFFLSPALKFKIESRYMRFGAKSFPEMLERCRPYTLESDAAKISCPTLVIDNEEEHLTKGEARKFFDHLQCPKEYALFKKEQATGGHCQPLGQFMTQETIFDWLDQILDRSGKMRPPIKKGS